MRNYCLREIGHDVLAVSEICRGASDHVVIAYALEEQRILLTSDTDFGALVFHQHIAHAGIILLRLDDERYDNKIRVLRTFFHNYGENIEGDFVVVTEDKVRIRKTP